MPNSSSPPTIAGMSMMAIFTCFFLLDLVLTPAQPESSEQIKIERCCYIYKSTEMDDVKYVGLPDSVEVLT